MKCSGVAAAAIAALALVLLLLLQAPASEAAVSCSDVVNDLTPCVNYLVSGSGKPPAACCTGAKTLASAATSTADKQTICQCIKSTSKSVNLNNQLAQALPANCGIATGLAFSPNMDCSKIT